MMTETYDLNNELAAQITDGVGEVG